MRTAHRSRRSILACSAFAGFRFPSDVIVLAVRWYLRLEDIPEPRVGWVVR
jgi:transposase-like protein